MIIYWSLKTFSKSSSLAGLRLGYALGNEKLINALTTVKDSFNSYPVDFMAQKCGELAVRDRKYAESVISRIIATRERFRKSAESLGWEVLPSTANFVFYPPKRSFPERKSIQSSGNGKSLYDSLTNPVFQIL